MNLKRFFERQPALAPHLQLGKRGERSARDYLAHSEGYRIVAFNVEIPLGRGRDARKIFGEIDIVAYDGDTLAFVEVKTRASGEVAGPERNVNLRKQRQIARAARRYRQLMKVVNEPYRYDVVTVLAGAEVEKLELMRGYFDDRVFLRARFFQSEYY